MKRFFWIAIFAGMTLLPASLTQACPMCKDSIPDSDAQERADVPGGFNLSVYTMLVGLLGTIGLSAGMIAKGVRNTNVQIVHDEFRNPNK